MKNMYKLRKKNTGHDVSMLSIKRQSLDFNQKRSSIFFLFNAKSFYWLSLLIRLSRGGRVPPQREGHLDL